MNAVVDHLIRGSISINGVNHELTHLGPATYKAPLELRGGFTKVAEIRVTFSNHCFSRRPIAREAIPTGHCVYDGPRSNPRDRIFCPRRYAMSKALPEVVARLLSGADDAVFESNHHNYVRLELAEEQANGAVVKVKYFVFLAMRKVQDPTGKYIKVIVESAYPEDALQEHLQPRLTKPHGFSTLLSRCWEARPDGNTGKKPKRKKKKAS